MRVLLEAVLGNSQPEAKLADTLLAHKAQLAAHAKGAPAQLALLIALEHYMSGVCMHMSTRFGLLFHACASMAVHCMQH